MHSATRVLSVTGPACDRGRQLPKLYVRGALLTHHIETTRSIHPLTPYYASRRCIVVLRPNSDVLLLLKATRLETLANLRPKLPRPQRRCGNMRSELFRPQTLKSQASETSDMDFKRHWVRNLLLRVSESWTLEWSLGFGAYTTCFAQGPK